MVMVLTFPGQGSQILGMGYELYKAFPEARLVFEEVDHALDHKLSDIMWNGPQEDLTATHNAQPALTAVSMALIRIMEKGGLCIDKHIDYVAGHSLGEYTALCAARAFSLADTIRLVRERGKSMQESVPEGLGGMAAIIGLDVSVVENICDHASRIGACQIANDNGGNQLVISGLKDAVKWAADSCLEKGASRAVFLNVSAPFHSSLMSPAAEVMERMLSVINKSDPIVPILPNVCASPFSDIDKISKFLVRQVTGRVRWRETIQWLLDHGATSIYEVGSGKVLTGLAKRIDRSISAVSISSIEDIDKALRFIIG
ncbi:ACP S-malonyltransferase [Candidatus Liberibacter americanus]|uniref:Malonyl CoA-acyl carrier protein transacylase n=1 Tax=Candidatus Liberibacter americanus str. Sao Paulo TaxID=1261131 RepID=U6B5T4_9HYPH|nr:ACP S-malonyltransferase [Candidatus Liberibacter americanus]AHA28228.1 (acyl-carrier-protein) S-malonyltransferase [Candidatus Liberibacter americanus str. Sao Paulo]EMS36258.1 ACP S-malonyltransferase [Candidatus Liberibacter americanus PW_SP]